MRHNKKVNHLGRQSAHRKALMANMATSLILHKRINTTLAKAKALRGYVEPVITKSKDDTTHARRTAFSYLKSKEAVTELFRNIAPRVADRPGGYTRILKTGFRLGDAAEMCIIELVDFNETYNASAPAAKAKTRRSRSAGAAKAEGASDAAVVEGAVAEGAEVEAKPAAAPKVAKKPAAKPAAKAGAKPTARNTAAKTSGSKAATGKSTVARKAQ